MTNDNTLLKNRIIDLAMQADTQGIYTCTRFLTPQEQSVVLALKPTLPITVRLIGRSSLPAGNNDGVSDSSIRKLAVFGDEESLGYEWEDPIRILHIRPKSQKFAQELSHRDYLGSLMALGIERELTGDIVVRKKEAWVFALDTIVPFLCENLTQVSHTMVLCEEVCEDVPELAPQFQAFSFNAASERMDILLSQVTGQNREDAKKLIKDDKVFINGLLVMSAGHKLRKGDEIVVRGYGKYIYDGVTSTTRKGRCNITLRKYI